MLYISLLGEQVITDGAAGIVRARSSRTVELVAFLVVHAGSPQPRGHIAGLFWPDSTDAQALTNLRRELYHLRHALGGDPSLVVTSAELCWRDTGTCRVDVRTFEIEHQAALTAAATGDSDRALDHATAAISLYRGALLPGGYQDWVLDARSGLERQCVALCDLISRTRAGKGDLTGAVAAGRRRIGLRPLEEVGYRSLMELQADLGDRAAAVSTYHHCASVLERDLGVEPDQATRRTLDRLMAQVAQPDVPRPGPSPPPVAPGSPEPSWSGDHGSSAGCTPCGGRPRWAARAWRWSGATAASVRPGWWPSSPRWPGRTARWWRAPNASQARGASRWPRWRTGCEIPRSGRRRRRWTRSGAPRSTGWCRPARDAEHPGPAR
jgi:DNA-binding SARP family transcriptional activator